MRSGFDLQRLRALRELHCRGTMSAVAEAMSYSTSAASQQLATLETELGIVLLDREGRRIRLTPEALILVRCTDDILRQLEEAAAAMESTDDDSGLVDDRLNADSHSRAIAACAR